jgi:hypothetical protein
LARLVTGNLITEQKIMSEKIELGWDGHKFVRGVFHDVDAPAAAAKKEPGLPVATPAPKCWVTQTLIYIRHPNPGQFQPPFGTSPQFWGSLADCRARARELGGELNLSIFEIGEINPDLKSKIFEGAGIYITVERFDQFSDKSGRCIRY